MHSSVRMPSTGSRASTNLAVWWRGTSLAWAGDMGTVRGKFVARATALLLVLSLTSSCTLLGAGIGAAIDASTPGPYQDRPAEKQWRLAVGDKVRLHLKDGSRVDGRYRGTVGPTSRDPEVYLWIDGDQPWLVAASDVRSLEVEVDGKGWLHGGMVGLLVDVALAVVFVNATRDRGNAMYLW